jgi:flavin reductase (DIM6/NTAB) family NADH-FMN oxidoreductase RutF
MRDFADRFAALSVTMANLLRQRAAGLDGNDALLAARWVERQDAGGYLIVGDPAARLSRI